MDNTNYTDLLEALTHNTHTVILAVIREGKLVDWVPAGEYCTVREAQIDHEWPSDAELSLIYGLDALRLYSVPDVPLARYPLKFNLKWYNRQVGLLRLACFRFWASSDVLLPF